MPCGTRTIPKPLGAILEMKIRAPILLISLTLFSSSATENQDPLVFGQMIYELLKENNFDKIASFYMTKSEFKVITNKSEITPDKDRLKYYLKNYDAFKTRFMDNFKLTIERDFFKGMDKLKLDSITYDYLMPKAGNDTRIKWPTSKTFEIDRSKITTTEINYHLRSEDTKYRLSIDFILVNGRLKLHEESGGPTIYND